MSTEYIIEAWGHAGPRVLIRTRVTAAIRHADGRVELALDDVRAGLRAAREVFSVACTCETAGADELPPDRFVISRAGAGAPPGDIDVYLFPYQGQPARTTRYHGRIDLVERVVTTLRQLPELSAAAPPVVAG